MFLCKTRKIISFFCHQWFYMIFLTIDEPKPANRKIIILKKKRTFIQIFICYSFHLIFLIIFGVVIVFFCTFYFFRCCRTVGVYVSYRFPPTFNSNYVFPCSLQYFWRVVFPLRHIGSAHGYELWNWYIYSCLIPAVCMKKKNRRTRSEKQRKKCTKNSHPKHSEITKNKKKKTIERNYV